MFDRFGNPRNECPPDSVTDNGFVFRQYNDETPKEAKRIADIAEKSGSWAVLYPSSITAGNIGVDVYVTSPKSLAIIMLAI